MSISSRNLSRTDSTWPFPEGFPLATSGICISVLVSLQRTFLGTNSRPLTRRNGAHSHSHYTPADVVFAGVLRKRSRKFASNINKPTKNLLAIDVRPKVNGSARRQTIVADELAVACPHGDAPLRLADEADKAASGIYVPGDTASAASGPLSRSHLRQTSLIVRRRR